MEEERNKTESIIERKLETGEDVSNDIAEDLKNIPPGTSGFVIIKGSSIGEKFFLKKNEASIGRSTDSDIFLDDVTVSRNHAVLKKIKEGYEIADKISLNGTYVNGERVDNCLLRNGDRIQIGKYVFLFFTI